MGNATTKSHYSKSQPLAATRRPRWEGSGRERDTHTHTHTDFRFCSLSSDICRRISIPRDDQGSMRHPERAVDRHLDQGFDSTRQSFGFARITIYIYIYIYYSLYICFASNIFFISEEEDIIILT